MKSIFHHFRRTFIEENLGGESPALNSLSYAFNTPKTYKRFNKKHETRN